MALDELLESYRQQFKDACPFTITNQGCSANFGGESSYHLMCQQLGGQIFEHSVILQCGIKPLNTDYDLGTVPECVGMSCNISEIDISVIGSPNISEFGSSLDNGGCQGKIESGTSIASSILLGVLATAASTLWALAPY